jgi:hypothetical protein
MENKGKNILIINDMPGYGKVALAAMLPILSNMGHSVYNLPTALVSNTLDYGVFTILDTTEYMQKAIEAWKQLGFRFDCFTTGSLASAAQVGIIRDFIASQKKEGLLVMTDPIMGENGSLYNGVTEETVENMRRLQTPLPIERLADGTDEPIKIDNYYHHFEQIRIMEVSRNTFDQLTWNQASEQVSITIEDYAYTQRVIDALQEKGFVAVSPYQLGSTKVDEEKAAQREQTLTVCLAALVAVAALQIVLLRAMFSVQTESYKLLSNIGLVSKTAKRSVLWQILGFTVLGQLVGGAAIWLCGRLGIERIQHILRYLPGKYIALLSGVHLIVSLFAALWVMRALGKQVYPLAGKFGDINLEDEEVAAA